MDRLTGKSDPIGYSSFNGQFSPSQELLSILGRQARWDDEGSGGLNPTGVRLRFEKIDEKAGEGGSVAARYRVFAPGAPENKVFTLQIWTVDKPVSSDPRDIYVNGQGLLMIHRPTPDQEVSFKAGDDELEVVFAAASAEPIRFIFASMDMQLKVFGTLVPHPVSAYDQGCKLEVRIAQPDAKAVLIVADGFPEKARIPLVLKSEDSTLSETLVTNTNGHAAMASFPYIPGKTQGVLKATAEGPGCLPSVVLPWGVAVDSAKKAP